MIRPYSYQQDAVNKLNHHFLEAIKALMVMATGLGKTVTAAFWAKPFIGKSRGLFLCHENDILEQALGEFQNVLGELRPQFGLFHGYEKTLEKVDILFASFQTMKNWKYEFSPDEFDFIIVDESHRGQAKTFKRVINYFKPRYLLGMTATPERGDRQDIREIFGTEVVDIPLEKAIAMGWLTQVDYRVITDNLDEKTLERLLNEAGRRISLEEINSQVFIKARDEEVAKIILTEDKKTIVFCRNVRHAEHFKRFIPNSRTYHSQHKRALNRETLQLFRKNGLQQVLVVDKFNEGIDIPDAEVLVFLRNTESETIFKQQLGRGLRKYGSKKCVIVLDFVANIQRIIYLYQLVKKIREEEQTGETSIEPDRFETEKDDPLHISGKGFKFNFTQEQVDLLEYLQKMQEVEFYQTWQEAGAAAQGIGIDNSTNYRKNYSLDPRLPSNPNRIYSDFPGWVRFLGGIERSRYSTWQEAQTAVHTLGIKTTREYERRHTEDPLLPGDLRVYTDFPGWRVFIGKGAIYKTWQEASQSAINLGIKGVSFYYKEYKKDSRLPAYPDETYPDFPGWRTFLGLEERTVYKTWQEASQAAINLGIQNRSEYAKKYKLDPNLPSNPHQRYSDFPGFPIFLGKKKASLYKTCRSASEAAICLGIKSKQDYLDRKNEDLKLPSNPDQTYKDFPGWKKFLGKE